MDEDALREQIEQLQARVEELETQQQQPEGWLSRREAIASVVGTLGLGALTGQVAASDTDPGTYDCSFDGTEFDVGGNLWNVDGLDATQLLSALDVAGHDLTDSGTKVYGASSNTVGDGTTRADHQSVSTDEASIGSTGTDYECYTDGTTIYGIPQRDGLAEVQGTSIGTFLEEIIKNELPPTGTDTEATGKVVFKAHNNGPYPGKLSDYSTESGVVGSQGLKIIGPGRQDPVAIQKTNVQPENNLCVFETDDDGFVNPVDSNETVSIGFELHGVTLLGPGSGTAGTIGLNGFNGSTQSDAADWDWVEFRNVSVWRFEQAFNFRYASQHACNFCHFQQFLDAHAGTSRHKYHQCQFFGETSGSGIRTLGRTTTFTQCNFNMQPDSSGTGPRSAQVVVQNGEFIYFGGGCKFDISQGHSAGGNNWGIIREPGAGTVMIDGVTFTGPAMTDCILDRGDQEGMIIGEMDDQTSSAATVELNGINGAVEPRIGDNANLRNGLEIKNSPTRPRLQGTVFVGGTPSGSNYDSGDAGLEVIDTSTSPPDVYKVNASGSLIGPL